MPTVLVTDYTFGDLDVERSILEPAGCTIVARQHKTPDALAADVADADYVITQFAPVNAAVIAAMTKTRVIVRYGIGVDNVDLAAARAKGIPVCNVPDYCIEEVADHTLALLLCATRQIVTNWSLVRTGQWKLAVPLDQMKSLADMTVGVVGFGRIGRAVTRRLGTFGCRVLVFDPAANADAIAQAGFIASDLPKLLAESDAVTLHCPSLDSTRQMINAQSIAAMKPGAILVNASRGDLVDSAALVDALKSGRLSAAALDVFNPEPVPADSPLLALDNVVATAHIASTSVKAVRTLRETAARTVVQRLRGEPLTNIVNGVNIS